MQNAITDWKAVFMGYVQRGYYSAFVRDLQNAGRTPQQLGQIHRAIREQWLAELREAHPELRPVTLADDGETVLMDISWLRGHLPALSRVMVGDHGVYVELNRLPPDAHYQRRHLQYDAYRWRGMKLYHQTKRVNYAGYIPQLCYVALEDVLLRLMPEECA